jgi:hypothetical protein
MATFFSNSAVNQMSTFQNYDLQDVGIKLTSGGFCIYIAVFLLSGQELCHLAFFSISKCFIPLM